MYQQSLSFSTLSLIYFVYNKNKKKSNWPIDFLENMVDVSKFKGDCFSAAEASNYETTSLQLNLKTGLIFHNPKVAASLPLRRPIMKQLPYS
jgi:hypothetical protein